jgi:hypothetical protein
MDVRLRSVHVTVFYVEKQTVLFILSVCVCLCVCVCVCVRARVSVASVAQHTQRMRRMYCHLWSVWLKHIFPHFFINCTIFRKKLLNIKCVFCISV